MTKTNYFPPPPQPEVKWSELRETDTTQQVLNYTKLQFCYIIRQFLFLVTTIKSSGLRLEWNLRRNYSRSRDNNKEIFARLNALRLGSAFCSSSREVTPLGSQVIIRLLCTRLIGAFAICILSLLLRLRRRSLGDNFHPFTGRQAEQNNGSGRRRRRRLGQ